MEGEGGGGVERGEGGGGGMEDGIWGGVGGGMKPPLYYCPLFTLSCYDIPLPRSVKV